MGDKTGIAWTDATWNPVAGCSIVSPACTNCYAMAQAARIQLMAAGAGKESHYDITTKEVNGKPVWTGVLKQAPERILTLPLRWKKPRRIFVNSMSDLFHESVPDAWIDEIFAVMALCSQHTFQVLTKRPKRMRDYLCEASARIAQQVYDSAPINHPLEHLGLTFAPKETPSLSIKAWPLPNVWLGVTAERQREADDRIPDLLATPAAVRFVSYEPALGPIDWKRWLPTRKPSRRPNGEPFLAPHFFMTRCEHCGWVGSSELCGADSFGDDSDVFCPACAKSICADELPRLDWVICGGESGPGARPMHPFWVRSLRDQCAAAGVPFFFTQRGEWSWPEDPTLPGYDEKNETLPAYHPEDWREKDRGILCLKPNGARCDGYAGAGEEFAYRIGARHAGRLLDGREHNEFPKARP